MVIYGNHILPFYILSFSMYFKNLFSNSIASSFCILTQFEIPLAQFFCKSFIRKYNTFIYAFSFMKEPLPFVTFLRPLFKLSIEFVVYIAFLIPTV